MPRWLASLFGLGRSRPLDAGQERLRLLEQQLGEAELKARKQLFESSLFAFDNLVDPREPLYDSGDFWLPLGSGESLPPNLDSRKRGEVLPVYITEYGLKVIRDQSRKQLAFNEFAICAVSNRIAYIVGKGMTYKLNRKGKQPVRQAGEKTADELVEKGQAVLDQFAAESDWGELEQEIILRCDRDGEAFVRFFAREDGTALVRFVEPEHVKTVGEDAEGSRSFGIETEPGDVETIKGYWIVERPEVNTATTFVPADEILHIKLNTDRNAKRGLPTLLPVRKNLERAEKLLRNMSTLAQVQSTFALIRKHKGYSAAAISAFQGTQADVQYQNPLTTKTNYFQQYQPGTILDVPENTEYDFPAASIAASQYVEVLQAELRAVASRLVMPEYMLTADASNANYSSTLVAEAPAVKNFERLQDLFARKFGRGGYRRGQHCGAMWRVLRIAVAFQLLPREVLTDCELTVEGPTLTVRDQAADTQRSQTLNQAGILSKTDWATEEGYDYDEQAEKIAAEGGGQQQPNQGQAQPPAREVGDEGDDPFAGLFGDDDEPDNDGGGGGGFLDFGEWLEAIVPNKVGPGCHDTETGLPAPCPGKDNAEPTLRGMKREIESGDEVASVARRLLRDTSELTNTAANEKVIDSLKEVVQHFHHEKKPGAVDDPFYGSIRNVRTHNVKMVSDRYRDVKALRDAGVAALLGNPDPEDAVILRKITVFAMKAVGKIEGFRDKKKQRKSRRAAEALEACIPNKTGDGFHDDKTGAPCSPNGQDEPSDNSKGSGKQGDEPSQAQGFQSKERLSNHGWDFLSGLPDDPEEAAGWFTNTIAKFKAWVAPLKAKFNALGAKLDSMTNVPAVKQVKRAIGTALRGVVEAQVKTFEIMRSRYGVSAAVGAVIASKLIASNPLLVPAWFLVTPGSALLVQLPLMAGFESLKQLVGLGKKAAGVKPDIGWQHAESLEQLRALIEADGDKRKFSTDEIVLLGTKLRDHLDKKFWTSLEPHKDEFAEVFAGLDDAETTESCVPNRTGKGYHDDKSGKPCKHGGDQPGAAPAKRVTKDDAAKHIDAAKANPSIESVAELADKLSRLTVAELREIKREHGIRLSGNKATLASKLAHEATRRLTEEQSWKRKARAAGVDWKSLRGYARFHQQNYNEGVDQIGKLMKEARRQYKSYTNGGTLSRSMKEFKGGDFSSIKHFDVIARSLAGSYPEVLGNHGYDQHAGYDSNAEQASEKLFELLAAGPQPHIRRGEAFEWAMDYLADPHNRNASAGRSASPDEEVPF